MTIEETLLEGWRLLEAPSPSALIEAPALDASLLLGEVLRKSRTELLAHGDDSLSEEQRDQFFALIQRRLGGECTAYILGRKEFRALDFIVNPSVLVPRPDTETLVEVVLELSNARQDLIDRGAVKDKGRSLLDLCTGSGALAISVKNERPFFDVTASDISAAALETAELNARQLLGDKNNIRFIHSDLFQNIDGRFDIIVSNPPYIASGEMSALPPEVRREPPLALDGGKDGLAIIRRIIERASGHLTDGGLLLLEADPRQMMAIRRLLTARRFGCITVFQDLAGLDRAIAGAAW